MLQFGAQSRRVISEDGERAHVLRDKAQRVRTSSSLPSRALSRIQLHSGWCAFCEHFRIMKTSRLLLAAVPAGLLAFGAVALGKWSLRSFFAPSSTARGDDRITPIPGSAEEVAGVAEAMAEEGGAVLVTEVAPIGEDEVVVAETLLVPDAKESDVDSHKA
ncbi:MAG: hypothetical protein ACRELY_11330 [Polyangiaceae bacterium]